MTDSHEIAERARILSHQVYARRMSEDPSLLEAARRLVERAERSGCASVGQRRWAELLQSKLRVIVDAMLDEGEDGRLLRASSPFSILIGVPDIETRKTLWRQARIDLSGAKISSGRSAA